MGKVRATHRRRLEACGLEAWDGRVDAGTVVDRDPPYADTTAHPAVGAFDHARLREVAASWTERGAVALVSEYAASEGWTVVAQFEHIGQLARGAGGRGRGSGCSRPAVCHDNAAVRGPVLVVDAQLVSDLV